MRSCVEYIWLDGSTPVKKLRSKCRIVEIDESCKVEASCFPLWTFDGSSTYQSTSDKSDLILKPVACYNDPLRPGKNNFLLMCEVFEQDMMPVSSNTRNALVSIMQKHSENYDPWVGFEQEYSFFHEGRPLGWPKEGLPKPQGDYYCGVGAGKMFGRQIVEEHMQACLNAGLMLFGVNAEVMPSSWEFQIGYRNFENESADPINICDQLWVARWLLVRIAENYGVKVSFDSKPVLGDWNGSGAHVNFSTKQMRDKDLGKMAIKEFIDNLQSSHQEHIKDYGQGLELRLTGKHETCDINTFRAGPRDRGASIRIPEKVDRDGYGYIEDRRPGANCDPYLVAFRLMKTLTKNRS